ncbi:MAG: Lar family restriction alleviation protein [Candidatus Electronema sp. V4]|uniref:Lar family restriction alleviation protein n=1 Tax=Candidatus Electronema sp. V4 TaxID=3454756 RepID=UPI0040556EC0
MSDLIGSELKPCPFCGGSAKLSKYDFSNMNYLKSFFVYPSGFFYSVTCPACQISFTDKTLQEASCKWNRRV